MHYRLLICSIILVFRFSGLGTGAEMVIVCSGVWGGTDESLGLSVDVMGVKYERSSLWFVWGRFRGGGGSYFCL